MARVSKTAAAVWSFLSRKELRPAEYVIVRALAVAGGSATVVKVVDLILASS